MKVLSLAEIERIRMHGMTEPTDFARLAHTARLAHKMGECLEVIASPYTYSEALDEIAIEGLKLWEQE